MHILPDGFHRIRHYGLLASGVRKTNLAKIRVVSRRWWKFEGGVISG
jgi:hypothetical protein